MDGRFLSLQESRRVEVLCALLQCRRDQFHVLSSLRSEDSGKLGKTHAGRLRVHGEGVAAIHSRQNRMDYVGSREFQVGHRAIGRGGVAWMIVVSVSRKLYRHEGNDERPYGGA